MSRSVRAELRLLLDGPLFDYKATVWDLTFMTEARLLELRGVGPATVSRIKKSLLEMGLALRTD